MSDIGSLRRIYDEEATAAATRPLDRGLWSQRWGNIATWDLPKKVDIVQLSAFFRVLFFYMINLETRECC